MEHILLQTDFIKNWYFYIPTYLFHECQTNLIYGRMDPPKTQCFERKQKKSWPRNIKWELNAKTNLFLFEFIGIVD